MKKIMSVSAVMVRISLNFNGEFYLAKGLNHSVDPSCKGLNRARWEGFFKKYVQNFLVPSSMHVGLTLQSYAHLIWE